MGLRKHAALQALLKLAYNADFNYYVNGAIEDAGYPIDPQMDWARWIETVFKSKLNYVSEDLRDEAIHDMLVHIFFERRVMERFDPSRLSEANQEKPLEQQVAGYAKAMIIMNLCTIQRYLKGAYAPDKESPVTDVVNPSTDIQNEQFLDSVNPSQPDAETTEILESEIDKLRLAFNTWVDRQQSLAADMKKVIQEFFNLITTEEGTRTDIIQKLAEEQHIGINQARSIFYRKLPPLLRKFAISPEGSPFNLARQIQDLPAKNTPEEVEKESPAFATTSSMENLMTTTNKYATFQRLAKERPADIAKAFIQLGTALNEIAVSASALPANLDLVQAPGAKLASTQRKFATSLMHYAAEEPEMVEDALNEIYNDVDKVMVAIENVAENLGLSLHEEPEMPLDEAPTEEGSPV